MSTARVAEERSAGRGIAVDRRRNVELKTILLATDGSEDAHAALSAAADLAQRSGATLHLVTAYDLPSIALYAYPTSAGLLDRSPFEAAAFTLLAAERAKVEALGASVSEVHAGMGAIFDVIINAAEAIRADLIVVGNRELSGLRRLLGENTSSGVVHGARCPVLIVRDRAPSWPPDGVIAGFDYSPPSERAARVAATVTHLYPGIALTLVQVLVDTVTHPNMLLRAPDLVEGERRRLDWQAERLERLAGSRVATTIGVGDPADELIACSDSAPVPKLIVVGTRGLGSIRRLVLGSVSTKILHSGHSPLLIIPESAKLRSG